MTQIEIAKKILKQNNCYGIRCGTCQLDENNYKCNSSGYNLTDRDRKELEQWLKEQEKKMIDLTKNQIVDPPVKCWIRDDAEDKWMDRWLVAIVDNKYYAIENIQHYETVELLDSFKYGRCAWNQCSLTDPTKPKFKPWLKVEDVPASLWGKALHRYKDESIDKACILAPYGISNSKGSILKNKVYLPLGKPLDGEWLEFGEWEK